MVNELKIKEYSFAVRVDKDNGVLYGFDLDMDNNTKESTEGILNFINPDIAKKIEEALDIKVVDYGVGVTECTTKFSMSELAMCQGEI